jgi:hypothetical protein
MGQVPVKFQQRGETYCRLRAKQIAALRGWGVDGFVWQTSNDSIIKVYRRSHLFESELAVYQRLSEHSVYRLRGFDIPILLDFDETVEVIEMSHVSPPYILDFAAATLGAPPAGFDHEDPHWHAEHARKFGADWPEVQRLLDALRQYGVHYTDVHAQNIRVR